MPLEISEIGIHLTVGAPGDGAAGQDAGPADAADAPSTPDTEQIVERCVAEVLRVLRQREAR